MIPRKLALLKRIISGYGSCLVAFSGGQDSAFLLKACSMVLPKDKLLAVTAVSAVYPRCELSKAVELAKYMGVRLKVIRSDGLLDKKFTINSPGRCYFCKKKLFTGLKQIAKENKINFVLEAGNLSDKGDYRPGNIAVKELKIESPLLEAGCSKNDIRALSKKLGLTTWNKPPQACLASRIPYGIKITRSVLKRVEQAEQYLASLGFDNVRIRHYDSLCRIEVEPEKLPETIAHRKKIIRRLKNLGYNYISLDLEGYRTGSLNEVIKQWPIRRFAPQGHPE